MIDLSHLFTDSCTIHITMEQSDSMTDMNCKYRWKFWGFQKDPKDNPCLLKESSDYFNTEAECVMDARGQYAQLKFPYMIVMSVVNEPPAKVPYYNTEERRIASFANWPPCMPFTGKEMSDIGFYYTGEYDKVVCFSCGIQVMKWKPFDAPLAEHRRHSPDCHFAKRCATSLKSVRFECDMDTM